MYRLIRAKQTDPETIKNMSLSLLAKNQPPEIDDECLVCHLAVEDGMALGFITAVEDVATAVGTADKPTLEIKDLRMAEFPQEKFAEVLEFIMRATIINARAEGIYERITIAPTKEYASQFEEGGFSEIEDRRCETGEDEPGGIGSDEAEPRRINTDEANPVRPGTMEYLLDCCQGYCPFCRAC